VVFCSHCGKEGKDDEIHCKKCDYTLWRSNDFDERPIVRDTKTIVQIIKVALGVGLVVMITIGVLIQFFSQ